MANVDRGDFVVGRENLRAAQDFHAAVVFQGPHKKLHVVAGDQSRIATEVFHLVGDTKVGSGSDIPSMAEVLSEAPLEAQVAVGIEGDFGEQDLDEYLGLCLV